MIFDQTFDAPSQVLVRWAITHLKISLILMWQRHTTTGIAALILGIVAHDLTEFSLSCLATNCLTICAWKRDNTIHSIVVLTSWVRVWSEPLGVNFSVGKQSFPTNQGFYSVGVIIQGIGLSTPDSKRLFCNFICTSSFLLSLISGQTRSDVAFNCC